MLKVNEVNRIYLGIQGENAARTIDIDVSEWLDGHPSGSVTIWHKRNGDVSPSATGATLDADRKVVSWTPTETDTYVAGEGEAEIRMTESSVIKKSRAVITGVSPAVTLAGTTLGSDWASYIDAVDGLRAEAVAAQEAAEDAQEDAEDAASDAEAYAVGTRGGEAVESTDPTYHNNAKYYSEQAGTDATSANEAKAAAISAKNDAVSAKTAAQAAQTAAENAKNAAISAKNDAVDAKNTAVSAKNDAVTAKTDAVSAKEAAQSAKSDAVSAKNDAVSAKNDAQSAKSDAQSAKDAAISAKEAAISAKEDAVTAKNAAVSAKNDAVSAKTAAQAAQTAAETAQGKAEDAQDAAEDAQDAAEDAQEAAELAQDAAEDAASDAEAYAAGTRDGEDVGSSDPAYHNNAKYYKEMAEEATDGKAPASILTQRDTAPKTAVVSFDDGAEALPMKLEINVDAVQDLHGYDYPWPAGGGANKLDPDNYETFTFGTAKRYGHTFSPGTYAIINNGGTGYQIYYRDGLSGTGVNVPPGGKATVTTTNDLIVYTEATTRLKTSCVRNDGGDSFVPWENICPISGWDQAKVTGTGKNLIPTGTDTNNGYVVNSWLDGSTGAVSEFAGEYVSEYFPVIAGETLTASELQYGASGLNNAGFCFYTEDKTFISGVSFQRQQYVTVTVPTDAKYCRTTQFTSTLPNKVMIERSNSMSAYESFGTVLTIPFTSTNYGGTVTLNKDGSADVVVTKKAVTLPDISSISDSSKAGSTGKIAVYGAYTDASYVSGTPTFIMENGNALGYNDCGNAGTAFINASKYINLYVPTDATVESVNSDYSGSKVVYELAEPITYHIENAGQIVALLGTNNLWADCGDMSAVYYQDLSVQMNAKANKADTVLDTTLSRGRKANTTVGTGSFAFGNNVEASGNYSHAEGSNTTASGECSHAEGYYTTADGTYAHAEGHYSVASGVISHAEGFLSTASGNCTHAEGNRATASGTYSHAEGSNTTASGVCSHAEGSNTTANHKCQHVSGMYNVEDPSESGSSSRGNYAEIIGNGTGSDAKSNARTLDWSGNERLMGDVFIGCNDDSTGGKAVGKELNKKAPAINETDSTEEAVKTITDGANNMPMEVKLSVDAVQDLHGYEYPWAGGAGKNLIPLTVAEIKSANSLATWDGNSTVINGITYTILMDSNGNVTGIKASGTASDNSYLYIAYNTITLSAGDYASLISDSAVGVSLQLRIGDISGADVMGGATTTQRTATISSETSVICRLRVPSGAQLSTPVTVFPMLAKQSTALSVADWQPYTNICPISGWDQAKVTRVKEQLYDKDAVQIREYINSSGEVTTSTTAEDERALNLTDYFDVEAGRGYTLKAESLSTLSGTETIAFCWFNGTTFMDRSTRTITLGGTSYISSATAPTGANKCRVNFFTSNFDSVVITESGTLAEYNISFPASAGTVYGATVTVNKSGTGLLKVDRLNLNVADIDTINSYGSGNSKYFYFTVTGIKRASASSEVPSDLICNMYAAISGTSATGSTDVKGIAISSNSDTMIIKDLDVADSTALKAKGITVVYPLATPIYTVLTESEACQILSLLGTNTLWADCGNVLQLDYFADTKLYIDRRLTELIAELS